MLGNVCHGRSLGVLGVVRAFLWGAGQLTPAEPAAALSVGTAPIAIISQAAPIAGTRLQPGKLVHIDTYTHP